jgi:hypothetical protein
VGIPSGKNAFPERHERPIPEYTNDLQLIKKVLETVIGFGMCGLTTQVLLMLWVPEQKKKVTLEEVSTYLGLELMAYQPVEIGKHLYEAYEKMQSLDQKGYHEYKDYHDMQDRLVMRCAFMKALDGIPLFARIGPPQEDYTAHDLPYLLYYPTRGSWYSKAEILVAEREYHSWGYFTNAPETLPLFYSILPDPNQKIEEFERVIKEKFRQVEGPKRFDWGRASY